MGWGCNDLSQEIYEKTGINPQYWDIHSIYKRRAYHLNKGGDTEWNGGEDDIEKALDSLIQQSEYEFITQVLGK